MAAKKSAKTVISVTLPWRGVFKNPRHVKWVERNIRVRLAPLGYAPDFFVSDDDNQPCPLCDESLPAQVRMAVLGGHLDDADLKLGGTWFLPGDVMV